MGSILLLSTKWQGNIFSFFNVLCFDYLTAKEYSSYLMHLLVCSFFIFCFVNKQWWVFQMCFLDRNIVAFCFMMYVSSVVGLICSTTQVIAIWIKIYFINELMYYFWYSYVFQLMMFDDCCRIFLEYTISKIECNFKFVYSIDNY